VVHKWLCVECHAILDAVGPASLAVLIERHERDRHGRTVVLNSLQVRNDPNYYVIGITPLSDEDAKFLSDLKVRW
jgi:NADH dehydrogenase FAD-containing subunit